LLFQVKEKERVCLQHPAFTTMHSAPDTLRTIKTEWSETCALWSVNARNHYFI